MEKPSVLSIKQKLAKSRRIWNDISNDQFLCVLYKILDNPKYNQILGWSADGKFVEIKNFTKVESEVLPLFDDCPTMLAFYRMLENCGFAQVFDWNLKDTIMFEHLEYTRYKRPLVDKRFVKKFFLESRAPERGEPGEHKEQIRKIQKKQSDEERGKFFDCQPQHQDDNQAKRVMDQMPFVLARLELMQQVQQLRDLLKLGETLQNLHGK